MRDSAVSRNVVLDHASSIDTYQSCSEGFLTLPFPSGHILLPLSHVRLNVMCNKVQSDNAVDSRGPLGYFDIMLSGLR